MTDVVHISSLLITARPIQVSHVCEVVENYDFSEIAHADDSGKIVVVLETSDEQAIVSAMTDIQLIEGVVNASLVYHQTESAAALNTFASGEPHA